GNAWVDPRERGGGWVANKQGGTSQHELRSDTELITSALIFVQRSRHLVKLAARYIQHGRADAPDRARQSEPLAESVLLGYGETALRIRLSNCCFTAQSVQNRGIVPGVSMRVCMLNRVGTFKRGIHLCDGPVHLAKNPEHPRAEGQHGHSSILAGCPSSHPVGIPAYAE